MHVLIFQEMLGELFTPVETPEAPNRGFFKGLFGGGAQSLDREELCMPSLHTQKPNFSTVRQYHLLQSLPAYFPLIS